ncbi:MAG: hypothetical protein AAF501_08795 [Pseudomonadota bacterium]
MARQDRWPEIEEGETGSRPSDCDVFIRPDGLSRRLRSIQISQKVGECGHRVVARGFFHADAISADIDRDKAVAGDLGCKTHLVLRIMLETSD